MEDPRDEMQPPETITQERWKDRCDVAETSVRELVASKRAMKSENAALVDRLAELETRHSDMLTRLGAIEAAAAKAASTVVVIPTGKLKISARVVPSLLPPAIHAQLKRLHPVSGEDDAMPVKMIIIEAPTVTGEHKEVIVAINREVEVANELMGRVEKLVEKAVEVAKGVAMMPPITTSGEDGD